MNRTILLAPNSFKECADSTTIASLIAGFLKGKTSLEIIEKPVSDGGDGFLNVCNKLFKGKILKYYSKTNYDDQIIEFPALYLRERKKVIIESAEVIGLKRIPPRFRHPMLLNSKSLGEIIKMISDDVREGILNVDEVIIGIGGTATVDFGLGAAEIFGLKAYDKNEKDLDLIPYNFTKINRLDIPELSLPFELKAISDVNTPLFGKNNSIELYSEQKGADLDEIKTLVKGFENIYNLLLYNKLIKSDRVLNGAGGGLAAGFEIFFNAKLTSSDDFILNEILGDIVTGDIEIVVTGEGAFDKQSLERKGAHIVIEKFRSSNIPVFLICGTFQHSLASSLPANVIVIELERFFSSREESIRNYKEGLKYAVGQIINHLKN